MDRRVSKTRAAIKKAYLELIAEKGSSRISVTDLAKRANIDRKTFYLHYTSTDDVLDEHIGERFTVIVEAMEQNGFFEDPFNAEGIIMLLDRFYKEEEELLLAVAGSDAYDDLWDHVHGILEDKVVELYAPMVNIDKEEIRIHFDFFGRGVIEVYRRWAKGEYTVGLHRLAEMIGDIAQTGLYQNFDINKAAAATAGVSKK